MKYKFIALSVSAVVILAGLINIFWGKGLNPGIDFAGGTLIRVVFNSEVPISEVRQALSDAGIENSRIQELENSRREYIIRTMQAPIDEQSQEEMDAHEIVGNLVVSALRGPEESPLLEKGLSDLNSIDDSTLSLLLMDKYPNTSQETSDAIIALRKSAGYHGIISSFEQLAGDGIDAEVIEFLKTKTFLSRLAVLNRETVGPQVGKDLRRKATQATIWALFGMLLYIGFRFKFAYGVSAILTLGHDVLVTLGIFSFTGREINLPVIAAVLTIVGYSLNDTIVIFDRVRDNLKILRKLSFGGILDTSINQTLSRTIITSGTTFLTVAALFIFGGDVINDFAFTMIIGVITGTYSSIYQSCSMLYFWKKIFKPKKGMGK